MLHHLAYFGIGIGCLFALFGLPPGICWLIDMVMANKGESKRIFQDYWGSWLSGTIVLIIIGLVYFVGFALGHWVFHI